MRHTKFPIIATTLFSALLLFSYLFPVRSQEHEPITTENVSQITELAILEGHTDVVNGVEFSPDGTVLASGSADTTVHLWDVETMSERAVLEGHTAAVNNVVFNSDGTLLASPASDKTIGLWDTDSGEDLGALGPDSHPLNPIIFGIADVEEDDPFEWYDVCFTADSAQMISVGQRDTEVIWIVEVRGAQSGLSGGSDSSEDSRSIAVSGEIVALGSGSIVSLKPISNLSANAWFSRDHTDPVVSVAFTTDGTLLASGSLDDTVRLWAVTDAYHAEALAVFEGHTDEVWSVAFSPDGTLLASASADGTIRLWDVESQEELAVLTVGEDVVVRSVAFSPDGTLLASGSDDNMVRLWGISA